MRDMDTGFWFLVSPGFQAPGVVPCRPKLIQRTLGDTRESGVIHTRERSNMIYTTSEPGNSERSSSFRPLPAEVSRQACVSTVLEVNQEASFVSSSVKRLENDIFLAY